MSLKKLSIKNSDVMGRLLDIISSSVDSFDPGLTIKIDRSNGVFDPLYVRLYESNPESKFMRIALAYGEYDNEGVFHADPEVHLGYLSKYAQWFPYYIKVGDAEQTVEKRSAEFNPEGKIIWQNSPAVQKEVHSFASSFVNQIREQQNLSLE